MSTFNVIGVLNNGVKYAANVPTNTRTSLAVQRASDWTIVLVALYPNGAPVDLTSAITQLTVKQNPNDGMATIARIGLPVPGAPKNVVSFSGVPKDTINLPFGRFTFDIQTKILGKWQPLVPLSSFYIEPNDGVPDQPLTAVSPVVFYYPYPPLIASFAQSGPTVFEIGDTLHNPNFTMVYNRTPSAASLYDGTTTVPLVNPFTSGGFTHDYTFTALNATQAFTLTASEAGGPDQALTITDTWQASAFWGPSVPGTYNAAFIQGLGSSVLVPSIDYSPGYSAGAGQFLYWASPTAFGGAPGDFLNALTNIAIGMSKAASAVSVTNGFGVTVPYDLWISDYADLGAITINIKGS